MSLYHLESKKILLDFYHAKEELNIKQEMIEQISELFNQAVSNYIEQSDLTSKWTEHIKKTDDVLDTILEDSNYKIPEQIEVIEKIQEDVSNDSYIKQIYREIVKKSHPDKLLALPEEEKNSRLKIYLSSSQAYETKNIAEILYGAHLLNINFEIRQEDIIVMKKAFDKTKKQSYFLEKTIPWKWYYTEDLKEKEDIINNFVKITISEI